MPNELKSRSLNFRFRSYYRNQRNSARTNRALDATWKLIVLVVGLSILGLGIFFLLFPGPGWATILLGLVVLASEYTWAKRLLNPVKRFTSALALRLMSDAYKQRRMHIALASTFIFIILLYAYWTKWDLTMDGLRLVSNALLDL
jgi:uncharacterized protein (TIGR02611 family)